MTQKKIRGDQLDLTLADGSVLSDVDAALLNGETNAVLHAAANLTGFVADARLNGPYNFNLTGTLTGTADNALNLGGSAASLYAKLASPGFSGNPTAPTQTAGNNTTRLATTAFVTTAVSAAGGTITKSESTAIATTSNSVSWLHGLGVEPDLVTIVIQCTSAEHGWSIGDRVVLSSGGISWQTNSDQDQNVGTVVNADSSRVYIRRPTYIGIVEKASPATRREITYAKWNYYITAMSVT